MSASATARRFFDEIWSQGDFDLVDELFAHEYVGHPSGPEESVRGPEGVKTYIGRLREGIPDLTMTIEDQVADQDKVATQVDRPRDARRRADGHGGDRADRHGHRDHDPALRSRTVGSSRAGRTGTCSEWSSSSASSPSPEPGL